MVIAAQEARKRVDLKAFADVNRKIIKLQAFFRMKLIRNKLMKKRDELRNTLHGKIDANKELINSFINSLKMKKLSPEEYFRAIDSKRQGKIPLEVFIEDLLKRGLIGTQSLATRLAFLIDEDVSGDITLDEVTKTLTAYRLPTEQIAMLITPNGTLTFE